MLPIIFKHFNRIVISTAAHIIIQIIFFNLLTRHIYTHISRDDDDEL